MKINFYFIFLILTFKFKYAETPTYINTWVVWNVGQGAWVTHIEPGECRHYDVGGEFGSFRTIKKTLIFHCGYKVNRLNLSHWDYDHFLNIPSLAKSVPRLCWEYIPTFFRNKKSAEKVLNLNIPNCSIKDNLKDSFLKLWVPSTAKDTNGSSTIFFEENVLMTGDSPIQQEKIWVREIEDLAFTRILILGHHGSRTSTGRDLLSHLPNLKFVVASARYAKYKHPHQDTLSRLSKFKIPVLKTEDWGNIWFE